MVVTSPTGDQAPPALAAISTAPAYIHRSRPEGISFRSMATITMAVARLSSRAEMTKAMPPTIQSIRRLFTVWIRSATS